MLSKTDKYGGLLKKDTIVIMKAVCIIEDEQASPSLLLDTLTHTQEGLFRSFPQ